MHNVYFHVEFILFKIGNLNILQLTLAASIGLRAMSAKNSADADAAKYNHVLYTYEFSSPIISE